MACGVAVLLDQLVEDQWWSQGGLPQSNDVYKDELRRYILSKV
jgi:hypothetical protein